MILTLCSIAFLISCGNNGSNYAWLEGVWEGEDENGNWAVAEISPNGYKYACSNWCDSPLDIKNQEESSLDIKVEENYILEKKVLAINDYLYIDPKNKTLMAIMGEYTTLPLRKKSNQPTSDGASLDESEGKSNCSGTQDSYYDDKIEEYHPIEARIKSLTPLQNIAGMDADSLSKETGVNLSQSSIDDDPYIAYNKTKYGSTDIIRIHYTVNDYDFYPCTINFYSSVNGKYKRFEYRPEVGMQKIASPANMKYYVEVWPGDNETAYFIKNLRDKTVMMVAGNKDGSFEEIDDIEIANNLLATNTISPICFEFTEDQLKRYKEYAHGGSPSVSIGDSLEGFGSGGLELKDENGNYRTYVAPFKSSYISFYTDDNESAMWTEVVGGGYHVPSSQVRMQYVLIDGKSYSIASVLNNPYLKSAVFITPQCWRKLDNGKLMINYEAAYQENPQIIYSSPKYIVMAGQLIEVNSGVNYKYDMNQRGFIAIIDQETMKADKNICLEGITRPEIHSIGNNYIVFNRDYYTYKKQHKLTDYDKKQLAISKDRAPIYLLRDDFSVKGCYIPDERETFLDVAWIADRFLVFCGTTKSHGYLDYDNPLLVVWDTQTNQTYKEYSSIKKTKGFLYTKIVKLPQDCLAVLFNVEASDTYAIKDIIAK